MTHRQDFSEVIKTEMSKYGLFEMGWDYSYDKAKRRLGQCCYGKKLISFSLPFIDCNPVEIMRNTVLHEIAHALVGPGNGHGSIWKRKAHLIGARAERCSSDKRIILPTGPYMFTCKCKSHYFYRANLLGYTRKCNVCKHVGSITHANIN